MGPLAFVSAAAHVYILGHTFHATARHQAAVRSAGTANGQLAGTGPVQVMEPFAERREVGGRQTPNSPSVADTVGSGVGWDFRPFSSGFPKTDRPLARPAHRVIATGRG